MESQLYTIEAHSEPFLSTVFTVKVLFPLILHPTLLPLYHLLQYVLFLGGFLLFGFTFDSRIHVIL